MPLRSATSSAWRTQKETTVTSTSLRSGKVEAIVVHDLVPRSHEITHELLLRVLLCIKLGDGSELGVEPKTRSTAVPLHLTWPVLRSRPSYTFLSEPDAFHSVPMSSRFTKKSLVNVPGRLVKTPCLDCPELAFMARMPPTRTVISGAVKFSMNARSTSSVSGDSSSPAWT